MKYSRWLYSDKCSDAGDKVAARSQYIQRYKSFGYCSVASANCGQGKPVSNVEGFDVLRWDDKEIIAVDSGLICVVNTRRADLTRRELP